MTKSPGKIALIAPARKMEAADIEIGKQCLQKWGFQLTEGAHLYSQHNQFAGTDSERILDFQNALNDPTVTILLCARGGYGSLRIVDAIDFTEANNKIIAGYSDITVFHNHLISKHNISSLHCTMPVNMASNSSESLESLKDALLRKNLHYEIAAHSLNKTGDAEGILFGGNLSLIYAMNGSSSLPNPNGKILFLEDLDEYLYHIDRMILNLKRSGILQKIAGLIIGGFTGMKDNPTPFGKTAEQIIREHTEEYNYPVCFGFPAGHVNDNRALIMGGKTRLTVNPDKVIVRSTWEQ